MSRVFGGLRPHLRSFPHLGLLALLLAMSLAASRPAPAESILPAGRAVIDTIVVISPRVDKNVLEVPAAVTVVGQRDIQRARPQLSLGESLAGVPGVFTQNRGNFAQDLRISLRGFGSRSNFGIRGIKLVVDGIPATLPDGQSQVDSLQLASAGRIEVMRGPSASLHGSAAGGVIHIESEEAPAVPFVEGRVAFGSHGYRGYDVDAQRDDRQRRDNDAGVPGRLRLDQREKVTSVRVFAKDELRLCSDVELTASLGFDHLGYRVDDHFVGAGRDDSGDRSFSQWTPMLGLRWSPLELANPYLRFSTSFEPPTTTELARPDGGGGVQRRPRPAARDEHRSGDQGTAARPHALRTRRLPRPYPR